jgi:hypothetical protein
VAPAERPAAAPSHGRCHHAALSIGTLHIKEKHGRCRHSGRRCLPIEDSPYGCINENGAGKNGMRGPRLAAPVTATAAAADASALGLPLLGVPPPDSLATLFRHTTSMRH